MEKDETMNSKKKNDLRRQVMAMLVIAGLIGACAAASIFFGHLLIPIFTGSVLVGPILLAVIVAASWAGLANIYFFNKPKHKQGYFVNRTQGSKGEKISEDKEIREIKEGLAEKIKGLIAENRNIKPNKVKSKSKGLESFSFSSASKQRISIGASAVGASLIMAGVMLYRPEILGAMAALAIGLNPIIAISIIAVGGILLVGGAYCFAKFRFKHVQDLKNNTEKIINNTVHDIVKETVSNKAMIRSARNINVAVKNDNEKEKIQHKNRYQVPLNTRISMNTGGRIIIKNPQNQVNRCIPTLKKIDLISRR